MKKYLLVLSTVLLLLTGCTKVELVDGGNALVKFNDDTAITAEKLYEKLVSVYGIDALVDLIDTELLEKIYDETDDEKAYINQMVSSIKEQAGDDFESYLSYYGVSTEKELKEFIRLNYRRNLYAEQYALENVTDKQINEYYETVAIGDIEASHILITSKATSDMTAEEKEEAEEEAYNKAKEIIEKLNKGEDFASLAKEYSEDTANSENGGALGYFNYDDNYDDSFMKAAIELEVNEYSKTPVKSAFGYHIIYKTDQKEKDKLENLKEEIRATIADETLESDTTLPAKALKALREEYEMDIVDTDLKSEYEDLVN